MRKRKLPLARDDAALLAEIALMYVVQVGHRRHRPLLTLTPQFSFLLKGFGTHFGMQRTVGTDLPTIDFRRLAEAQGIPAQRITEAQDLDRALRGAFASADPTLLDVWVS